MLAVALVVPVAVLLFLRTFGRNEFEVKPLFNDSLPVRPSYCPDVQLPYTLPDLVRKRLNFTGKIPLVLYLTEGPDPIFLQRIRSSFNEQELGLVVISDSTLHNSPSGNSISVAADSILLYSRCYLFLPEQKSMTLVDNQGRIRGHYGSSREETDRLLTEAAIILKKY